MSDKAAPLGGRLPLYHPAALIATWFGSGRLRPAPGTWGSAAALPFAWGLQAWGDNTALGLAALLLFPVGWWASSVYAAHLGEGDPGEVVVDEVVAQWLVLCFAPHNLIFFLIGFLLFRIADILKPWPASWSDRTVKGGFGIMLDDILAAPYAVAGLLAIRWLWGEG